MRAHVGKPPVQKRAWLHLVRCLAVLALAVPLRMAQQGRMTQQDGIAQQDRDLAGSEISDGQEASGERDGEPGLAQVRALLPKAARVGAAQAGSPWYVVEDADGEPLGWAAVTWPLAREVVGYRGPSNLLVITDTEGRIGDAQVLWSRDTPEHVEAITASGEFFPAMRGRKIGEPLGDVDAVSGATLTSLAMRASLEMLLTGQRPTLKFPNNVTLSEARTLFPGASRLRPLGGVDGWSMVLAPDGREWGGVARTGVLVEDVLGYQGPSELLVAIDLDDRVTSVRLRQTYDNEPYVDYVREEDYFWEQLSGRTLSELAAGNTDGPEPPGGLQSGESVAAPVAWDVELVEGVSGATMTSQTVALSLSAWATEVLRLRLEAQASQETTGIVSILRGWHWSAKEIAIVMFAVLGVWLGNTHLRGRKSLRLVWAVALVVGLGGWAGGLLSQALILGWAEQGVAWQFAPGLTVLLGLALLAPPLSKRNLYCHQLCPHGAVQQLVKRRLRVRWHPSPRVSRWLAWLPGALLIVAYGIALLDLRISLATLEPFNAYLWPVAAGASVCLALGSLAFAAVVPMGYCRFGCPTGKLLDYLRRHARSGQWQPGDTVLCVVTVAAWGILWVTR